MNTDGFVKCNGKVLADKAKLYIELIQPENERLVEEHHTACKARMDLYHSDRSDAYDYAHNRAMGDLQAVLEPYFVNKTVQHGMWWWYRETIESNLDLQAVTKNHDSIKDALVQKYPNLWRYLPENWYQSLPDFSWLIQLSRNERMLSTINMGGLDWYTIPKGWLDISSLHQLLVLDDTDVFLSIQNYNIFIAAADRYDELMQRQLEPLDAPLHQSN